MPDWRPALPGKKIRLALLSSIKKYLKKIRSSWRYSRIKKNLDASRRGKKFDVNQFKMIFIDPCFHTCNLKCPYCPVGIGLKLKDMSRGFMTLDALKEIWTKSLKEYNGKIGLYNWGESFLNPELAGIVRFLKENSRAYLILNSNFSFSSDEKILEILKWLDDDTIIISCDGFSQETCEKYRVNVDFARVMHNVSLIIENKKPRTKLKWQYLKFPWNLDEIGAAEEFCRKNNIIFYTGDGGITPDYPMLPTPYSFNPEKFRCEFFIDALTINFDGEVYPCCAYFGPKNYSLGNARENSLMEIFTNGKGREMLEYLTLKSNVGDNLFCKICVERNSGELDSWKI